MCRWFVYASATEECLLDDVLVQPQHGLSKMVNEHFLPGLIHSNPADSDADKEAAARNLVLNVDGLGLVWYTSSRADFNSCEGTRPAMYKSISPALNDFNFRNLCANVSTRLLFAHIRASSGSAVTQVNCHPFIFGRTSFMHNGTVANFVDIRRQVCNLLDRDTFANVIGSSDSEHLAALYMTILTKGKGKDSWEQEYSCNDMLKALCEAVTKIIKLQQEVLGKGARPSSLNLAVTDGKRLLCFRMRNHKTEQPPSLYWSTTAGQTLNRKYPDHPDGAENPLATKASDDHGKHIIVASEPTTYKEDQWHLIERSQYLTVDENGDVTQGVIPYDQSLNLDDDALQSQKLSSSYRALSGCSPS